MPRPLFVLVLLLGSTDARTQILSPSVIASSGASTTAGGVRLDGTIGEPMITAIEGGGARLTQGFHQADPVHLRVNIRALLQGAYDAALGSQRDDLRSAGYLPMSEPYTVLGYTQVGGGGETTTATVFSTAGPDAVVDWILLELRDPDDSTVITATRCALLQRDGDIVDVDGMSSVAFAAPKGVHYIAVRHRSHFGVMTLTPVALGTTATTIDLTNGSTGTHGTDAQVILGTVRLLWAGDVNRDGTIKYTGTDNDRDPILSAIGGVVPTNSTTGYAGTDVNMNGVTKYTGADNDRDVILQNIGGVVPTNTRQAQLP